MKKILTADNTETFLNEEIGESYHSQTGAVEEALKKFVIPCKIQELAKKGSIKILDVCFGMGYNSAMAIEVALRENPDCEIEVVGLEHDDNIISKIQEVNPPIDYYENYKKITLGNLKLNDNHINIKIILGDSRETVKQLQENYFDAIFFDPFSPNTSPEMWSEELFKELWRVMKLTGILATYSSAPLARENMSKAGWLYDNGPIAGRRGPGTIATKWV